MSKLVLFCHMPFHQPNIPLLQACRYKKRTVWQVAHADSGAYVGSAEAAQRQVGAAAQLTNSSQIRSTYL